MKSIHKLFFIPILCCLWPGLLWAQEQPSLEPDAETEENAFSWRPSALRVGLDASSLAVTLVEPGVRLFEVNTDLQFGQYFLVADWGIGSRQRNTDQLDYRTEGSYFRLGADVNFIPENKDDNVLFVGVRYGRSVYSEQLDAVYPAYVFDPFPVAFDRQLSAHWFEGVAGMKARLLKGLFLGYTLRYKFGLKTRNSKGLNSYEVPGFGRTGDGNTFAFNYHVFYRIPF